MRNDRSPDIRANQRPNDRFWQTFGKSMIGYLAWGLLTALMVGCATTPESEVIPVVPDVPVYVVNMRDYFPNIPHGQVPRAATGCDSANVPRIFVDSFQVGKPDYSRLMVHERTHVRQVYASGGDCTAFMARYKADPEFRFRMEVEAECAAVASENLSIEKFNEELAWMITFTLQRPDLFGSMLPEAVTAYITRICQKARSRTS